jgi:NADPH-dependent 2,4-dienoyl-CoA reductase/sulfur reductase-like enzyme/nitrite reductase/ring-hydroxylating ferredoxin subunit
MADREQAVATVDELRDGEMKQISAAGTQVLLARVNGNYHAVAAHCTHYGAPLVDGVINGDRIVCPWHHACFNAITGDVEEPPALDSLPCFPVRVGNGKVFVDVPVDANDRRMPPMTTRQRIDKRVFVIVGGGAAGYTAAQTLREDGFTGRLIMITRESHLPYDRPNLSKEYLQGKADPAWMPLRSDEFFAEHDVDVISNREVERVDAAKKLITFADGDTLICDRLLIATGGEPRKLPFQTDEQQNVFLLRSYADADAIIGAADKDKQAIVIGASFIGMEVAASLTKRGCKVTVVAGDTPFKRIFGPEIGYLFQRVHERNGVEFKLGTSVTGFAGSPKVKAVVLDPGEQLEADLVVVGIGVTPATGLLTGVKLHKDGGVLVDEYMRAADGVYAAGDIAWFPSQLSGEGQRIEHWRTAMQQGRVAAHNMAGKETPYNGVPFFWTRQFDVGLLYIGHALSWDEIIFQGDVPARDFLAFYISGSRVTAVAGMNRDKEMASLEELMRLDRMPAVHQLRQGTADFSELLRDNASTEPRLLAQAN